MNEKMALSLNKKAWDLAKNGQLEQANELIIEACKLDPEYSLHWTYRAHFLEEMGRLEEAEEAAR